MYNEAFNAYCAPWSNQIFCEYLFKRRGANAYLQHQPSIIYTMDNTHGITTYPNFVQTPTSDSGIVLNFEFIHLFV